MTLALTSTRDHSVSYAHSHANCNDRESEPADHNLSGDDDSIPLISPDSSDHLPVTVTHLSSKGKIELVQLSSESSSVISGARKATQIKETASVSPVSVDPAITANKQNCNNENENEIMIVGAANTNPFTNLLQSETRANDSNPFDDYDQITSILITSTNPFHNPFLMSSEVEGQARGADDEISIPPKSDKPEVKTRGDGESVRNFSFEDERNKQHFDPFC